MDNKATMYLKINDIEFCDKKEIDGKFYDLMPSSVTPSVEIIKNVERSLGGKASIDITDKKIKLQAVFDFLENDAFEWLLEKLNVETPENMSPDGVKIEYFGFRSTEAKTVVCYLDDVSYVPLIKEDKIYWQNVTLVFVEI